MKKTVYISVVSHGHTSIIKENFSYIKKEFDGFEIKVSIIDNTPSLELKEFAKQKGFFYYCDGITRGYGANHNKLFSVLDVKDEDIFIVCNPDIYIKNDQLEGLLNAFVNSDADIYNIKSYLDKNSEFIDFPDRYFPGIFNFFISITTGKRLHYGENEEIKEPEWMSGGFMVFKPASYKKLGGFDEDYFMYCEDIDICFRAKKAGMKLRYDNRFYNEHNSSMHSRKLFSKSMFWHLNSAFKYVVKNRFYKPIVFAKAG